MSIIGGISTTTSNPGIIPGSSVQLNAGQNNNQLTVLDGYTANGSTSFVIGTYTMLVSQGARFSCSLVATDGAGNYYSSDLTFGAYSQASATLLPATPTPINVFTAGSGSTCGVSVTVSGLVVSINVTSIAATTVKWNASISVLVVS